MFGLTVNSAKSRWPCDFVKLQNQGDSVWFCRSHCRSKHKFGRMVFQSSAWWFGYVAIKTGSWGCSFSRYAVWEVPKEGYWHYYKNEW